MTQRHLQAKAMDAQGRRTREAWQESPMKELITKWGPEQIKPNFPRLTDGSNCSETEEFTHPKRFRGVDRLAILQNWLQTLAR